MSAAAPGAPTVAYLMSRFPHVTETFIAREMSAVQAAGCRVVPYPLLRQRQPVVQPSAEPWVRCARWLSPSPLLVWANVATAVRQPRAYASAWWRALSGTTADPRFLLRTVVIVPKAVLAARRMRQDGVSHIHAHYATHPALAAWVAHRLTGLPFSVTVHAHDIFVRAPMTATKLRDARFVVAVSEYNRRHLAGLVGPWVAEKTHVVHCGIEPTTYRPVEGHLRPRERALRLLAVGSLQEYKGHRHLLEAVALLRSRGVPVRCRIVGEGAERPDLERRIVELGLAGDVELLGWRSEEEVVELLRDADCYLQPSVVARNGQMEGIPVALMEAMAAGVPVVATHLSGVPELVRSGETGLLVPPGDAAALAGAVGEIARDPLAARRRAAGGQEVVRREFDLHANARALAALFASGPTHGPAGSPATPTRRARGLAQATEGGDPG